MKKLEIGPSRKRTPDGCSRDTWDTVDTNYSPTFRVAWGHERIPVEENTYDWVHASHVLEHVPWWHSLDALIEARRVLKPGGRLTVWVPNGLAIIQKYLSDPEGLSELEKGWKCGGQNPDKDPWVYMNARVFWGARRGERGQQQHFHKALFSGDSLTSLLSKAGFSSVADIERDSGHGWMEVGREGVK